MRTRVNLHGFELGDAGPIQARRVGRAAGNLAMLARSTAGAGGCLVWSPCGSVTYTAPLLELAELRKRYGAVTRANARELEAALLDAYRRVRPGLPLEADARTA